MADMTPNKNPMPVQDPEVRAHNFEEVALGYSEETAMGKVRCRTEAKCPRKESGNRPLVPMSHQRLRLPKRTACGNWS